MPNLQEFVAEGVALFRTHAALGRAIDVSASRISRVMKKGGGDSLNPLNCLKLADVIGRSASEVLRAAGKDDVAILIERLYGTPNPRPVGVSVKYQEALRNPAIVNAVDALLQLPDDAVASASAIVSDAVALALKLAARPREKTGRHRKSA